MIVRALAVAVAMIAVASACGPDPTKIELTVVYDDTWQLSDLRLASDMESSTIDAAHRVTVLVPDGWAEEPVRIELWGMRAADTWAHGEVTVTPAMRETVPASVTLTRVPCGAWCVAGATMCVADGVSVCEQRDSDSCFEWSEPVKCAGATPYCSLGMCLASCVNECVDGETRCAGPNGEQLCGDNDSDNCTDWLQTVACGQGETCSNGSCRDMCQDECVAGTTMCSGGGVSSCADLNGDGCAEWGPVSMCPGGICGNGMCQTSCTDECTASVCNGLDNLILHTCGQFDLDSCKDLSPGTSCVPADSCLEGGCTPQMGCTSAPKVCDQVPDPECVDSNTVRTFYGACSAGSCSYPSQDTDCVGSATCNNGSCGCSETMCMPTTFASSQDGAYEITADAAHVYWTTFDGGAVMRRSKANGSVETFASGLTRPMGIALDATHVYWTSDSGLARKAKAGGAVEPLATGGLNPVTDVAVDANYVYFSKFYDVIRANKDGTGAITWVNGQDHDAGELAIDANYVYWTVFEGVDRKSKAGGSVQTVIEYSALGTGGLREVLNLAVDDYHVYITQREPTTDVGEVLRQAKDGSGSLDTINAGTPGPYGVFVDATHVYWTTTQGVLRRKKTVGSVEAVAGGQGEVAGVVADDSYIYWTRNADDAVGRLSRCACGL